MHNRKAAPAGTGAFLMLAILAALALIVWILNSYLPIQRKYKTIANVVIVAAVLAWLAVLGYHRLFPPPPAGPPSLTY